MSYPTTEGSHLNVTDRQNELIDYGLRYYPFPMEWVRVCRPHVLHSLQQKEGEVKKIVGHADLVLLGDVDDTFCDNVGWRYDQISFLARLRGLAPLDPIDEIITHYKARISLYVKEKRPDLQAVYDKLGHPNYNRHMRPFHPRIKEVLDEIEGTGLATFGAYLTGRPPRIEQVTRNALSKKWRDVPVFCKPPGEYPLGIPTEFNEPWKAILAYELSGILSGTPVVLIENELKQRNTFAMYPHLNIFAVPQDWDNMVTMITDIRRELAQKKR